MYTIKHAAEVTGLSPATLRAWERRYGVVSPHRTESGYRLYDEQTFGALTMMAELVAQGWSPRQAAAETRRRIDEGAVQLPEQGPGQRADLGEATAAADTQAFVDAAADLDVSALTALMDERFSVASFEAVVDGWLMPSLIRLGEAWEEGRVSVAGEHLASYAVMRRLAAAYDGSAARATGHAVMVGLPPGSRHELGVLAFAVAARRIGLRAFYLGADLPAVDWVGAVKARRPRAVVLSAVLASDVAPLQAVVESLRAVDPALTVTVGGAQQGSAPDDCLRLGHEIGAAAVRLAAILRAAPSG